MGPFAGWLLRVVLVIGAFRLAGATDPVKPATGMLLGAEIEVGSELAAIADRFDYANVQATFHLNEVLPEPWLKRVTDDYVRFPGAFESLPAETRQRLLNGEEWNPGNANLVRRILRRWKQIPLVERAPLVQVNRLSTANKAIYLRHLLKQRLIAAVPEAAMAQLPLRAGAQLPPGFHWHRDLGVLELSHVAPVDSVEAYLASLSTIMNVFLQPLDSLNHLAPRGTHRMSYHVHVSFPLKPEHKSLLSAYNELVAVRRVAARRGAHVFNADSMVGFKTELTHRGQVRLIDEGIESNRFHFEVRAHTKPPEQELAELKRWFGADGLPAAEARAEMAAEIQRALGKTRVRTELQSGMGAPRFLSMVEWTWRNAPAPRRVLPPSDPEVSHLAIGSNTHTFLEAVAPRGVSEIEPTVHALLDLATHATASPNIRQAARLLVGDSVHLTDPQRNAVAAALVSYPWRPENIDILSDGLREAFFDLPSQRRDWAAAVIHRASNGNLPSDPGPLGLLLAHAVIYSPVPGQTLVRINELLQSPTLTGQQAAIAAHIRQTLESRPLWPNRVGIPTAVQTLQAQSPWALSRLDQIASTSAACLAPLRAL